MNKNIFDDGFSESIARLQGWLQFLERKATEYQAQINRVKRGQSSVPVPDTNAAVVAESAAAPKEGEDPWL